MKTKQEILNYLENRKEIYQNNIIRYNEILTHLSHNSNDYMMYELLRNKTKENLIVINDLLDFINDNIEN